MQIRGYKLVLVGEALVVIELNEETNQYLKVIYMERFKGFEAENFTCMEQNKITAVGELGLFRDVEYTL